MNTVLINIRDLSIVKYLYINLVYLTYQYFQDVKRMLFLQSAKFKTVQEICCVSPNRFYFVSSRPEEAKLFHGIDCYRCVLLTSYF